MCLVIKKCAVYPGSVYQGCCKSGENKHKCGTNNWNACLFQGNRYEWVNDPDDCPIMDVPDWLLKYIKAGNCKKRY